jgi:hypothetical protein
VLGVPLGRAERRDLFGRAPQSPSRTPQALSETPLQRSPDPESSPRAPKRDLVGERLAAILRVIRSFVWDCSTWNDQEATRCRPTTHRGDDRRWAGDCLCDDDLARCWPEIFESPEFSLDVLEAELANHMPLEVVAALTSLHEPHQCCRVEDRNRQAREARSRSKICDSALGGTGTGSRSSKSSSRKGPRSLNVEGPEGRPERPRIEDQPLRDCPRRPVPGQVDASPPARD